ncbi:MAG: GNAT family N-acetyltransferase [archaeon]
MKTVFISIKEFSDMHKEWNDLLGKTKYPNLFLTWEWLYSWWEIFQKKNYELAVVAFYDKSELVGISPTFLHKTPFGNIVRLLGDESVDSCYLDIIAKQEFRQFVLSKTKKLFENDSILFKYVDNDSDLKYRFTDKPIELSKCPIVELPENIEDYLARLSRNERHNYRRAAKEYKDVKFSADHDLSTVFSINKKRFGSQSFSPKQRDFLKKFSSRFSEYEVLKYEIENDAAYNLNYYYKNTVFFYSAAFVSQEKNLGIGKALCFKNIENSIKNRYSYFDMLRGTQEYKTKLSSRMKTNIGLYEGKGTYKTLFFILKLLNKISYQIEKYMPSRIKQALQKSWIARVVR